MNGKCLKLLVCAGACAITAVGCFARSAFSLDKLSDLEDKKLNTLSKIAYENGYGNENETSNVAGNVEARSEEKLTRNKLQNMDEYMQSDLVSASASKEYFDTKEKLDAEYNENLSGAVVGLSAGVFLSIPTIVSTSNAIKARKGKEEKECVKDVGRGLV